MRPLAVGTALSAVLLLAGCGGSTPVAPLDQAPTALATEAPVESAATGPTAQPTRKPKPTKKPSYYTPPGWDGVADVNCSDFKTHKQAVSFFKGTGGTKKNDPYGLDSDHDGNACETLP
jgi:hypothetical protein